MGTMYVPNFEFIFCKMKVSNSYCQPCENKIFNNMSHNVEYMSSTILKLIIVEIISILNIGNLIY